MVHPAVIEEMDGTELALDFETLLVDFFRVNPGVLPEANSLLAAAQHWVEEGGDRVKFYSAAEEEALTVPQTPQTKQKKPKAPAAPKRVTTAALAEQLSQRHCPISQEEDLAFRLISSLVRLQL